MFTGIITKTTSLEKSWEENESLFITFHKPLDWQIKLGDSLATNGTCLTVKEITDDTYTVELMPETLAKTTFSKNIPAWVNLEQSLRLSDRLDGHMVTGHVDSLGEVIDIQEQGNTHLLIIAFPKEFSKLIARKGSITVDGVSLTVVDVTVETFSVSVVDYTWQHTTLSFLEKGSLVNLEFDILAKYVARMVQ